MEKYGIKRYGWKKINDPQKLIDLIKSGTYIGLSVTNEEYIRNHPNHIGHMAVVVSDTKGVVGVTQSINNRLFRPFQSRNDPILHSQEFVFYIHPIP